MAVFEKDRASRRYYLRSTDSWGSIKSPGGIPTGSVATYTDTGAKFIYDGSAWVPWAGEEEELLVEIRDALNVMVRDARVTRQAVATVANEQSGTNFPTDDK